MTAALAIPATTHILREIIVERLKLAYAGGTVPPVSIDPPPRLPPPPASTAAAVAVAEPVALTLYMHHAGANTAWRNMHDPHVDADGRRIGKAPLVLDLNYMLAAHGSTLEREAVLGIAMSALHRYGIVPRDKITALMAANTPPAPDGALIEKLTEEPLDDKASQPESITISLAPIDIDLSTKLWSALQTPIRPSAFYLVTTVFLDIDDSYPPGVAVKRVAVASRPTADPKAEMGADDVLALP